MFSESDMTSDKPYEAPVLSISEAPEKRDQVKKADLYFESNAFSRVPLIALESDVQKVPGQNWAVLSIIKPEEYKSLKHKNGNYSGLLIKFRGAFNTREEAETHIKKVLKIDKHFDIHLVPAFSWAGVEDDCVEDREYANEMIGEIMRGYFENENLKIKSIRDRIRNTEDPTTMRSDEASAFFDSATAKTSLIEDSCNTVLKQEEPAISMDELALRYGVEAKARPRFDYGTIGNYDSVVAEVLLDDADLE